MTDVFSALAHPVRRDVLRHLKDGAMTAGEIADRTGAAKPTLSGHLKVLKNADLVSVERRGSSLLYRINLSVLEEAMAGFLDLFAAAEGEWSSKRAAARKSGGGT